MARRRYLGKLSGPLLDRVDLRVEMHTARAGAFAVEEGESTAVVRERVAGARAVAEERWRPHGIRTNAEVSGALLRRKFRPEAAAMEPLRTALDRGLLSIRGVDRTLRVADLCRDQAGGVRTKPTFRRNQSRLPMGLPCVHQTGSARSSHARLADFSLSSCFKSSRIDRRPSPNRRKLTSQLIPVSRE